MQIIHITDATITAGKAAFRRYTSACLCGPMADIYAHGLRRQTGLAVIPGAIVACIEAGMITEDEIVNGVARLSLCRRSTVQAILFALCGEDPEHHIWRTDADGDFELLGRSTPTVLFTA